LLNVSGFMSCPDLASDDDDDDDRGPSCDHVVVDVVVG